MHQKPKIWGPLLEAVIKTYFLLLATRISEMSICKGIDGGSKAGEISQADAAREHLHGRAPQFQLDGRV